MKCIIAGSRNITDMTVLEQAVRDCPWSDQIIEIVSGTAKGVDQLGEQFARQHDLKLTRFPADWKQFGRGAGRVRNEEMGDYADAAIVLWDGQSTGSKHMIDNMKTRGKRILSTITKRLE
jgi:hypothetical protein